MEAQGFCENCTDWFSRLLFVATEPGGKHPLAPLYVTYYFCSQACRDAFVEAMHAPDPTDESEPPTPVPTTVQTVDPIPAMEAAMPAALGEAWNEWREACYCEDVPPAVALITLVHHAAKRGATAAVDMLAPADPRDEPATPTPATTPPALDTHTLELPVRLPCEACGGKGEYKHPVPARFEPQGWEWDECAECFGLGYHERTVMLSDEAVDRLVSEIAKRMREAQR